MPAGTTRNQRRMALLYRLALALSLPSKAQDVGLAREFCREASELRSAAKIRSVEVNGTLDGQRLTLIVSAGRCSDGMSDIVYPFTVRCVLGGEEQHGCAKPR